MSYKWLSLLFLLMIVSSCLDGQKTEWGVRINVVLEDGGSAVLVCPKYKTQPLGSHGRECYIESINGN